MNGRSTSAFKVVLMININRPGKTRVFLGTGNFRFKEEFLWEPEARCVPQQ